MANMAQNGYHDIAQQIMAEEQAAQKQTPTAEGPPSQEEAVNDITQNPEELIQGILSGEIALNQLPFDVPDAMSEQQLWSDPSVVEEASRLYEEVNGPVQGSDGEYEMIGAIAYLLEQQAEQSMDREQEFDQQMLMQE